ncbi:hypothetical protein [uncultured Sunxiuqinia sp.]|uniref:hypothetical protein n=1 Tax=uncultured Sunxiuqinia sp. TaxID=1573825 RepID=UPI0030D8BF5D
MKITWDIFSEVPASNGMREQRGLAGPVTGVHQNRLVVAGGANFNGRMPWQGGEKEYHDTIFLSQETANGQLKWEQPDVRLPERIAYSACVSTEKGIVSLGGETANGPTAQAFLVSLDSADPQLIDLPRLPIALSTSGAALCGTTLYLAGGLGSNGASRAFFALDLNDESPAWMKLPDMPVACSHAVVVCQHDGQEECIYLIGGRNKTGTTSTFLSDIWKYLPSEASWQKDGTLQVEGGAVCGLSAGTGLAHGMDSILIFGGDTGEAFNQTERLIHAVAAAEAPEEKVRLLKLKENHLNNHPGFCNEVFCWNTHNARLSRVGKMDGATPVTTTAIWWNGQIMIPGGEVRPGVRSCRVIRGVLVSA